MRVQCAATPLRRGQGGLIAIEHCFANVDPSGDMLRVIVAAPASGPIAVQPAPWGEGRSGKKCRARRENSSSRTGFNALSPSGAAQSYARPYTASEIQMFDAQRVLLNEFTPGFHHIAHQLGKDVIGLGQIFNLYLQQGARLGVQRGFP